jgi:hypothetical protein
MPPKPPLMVDQIIPRAIEVLQQRQERIKRTVAAGGYVDTADDTHILDLCKQILETPEQ